MYTYRAFAGVVHGDGIPNHVSELRGLDICREKDHPAYCSAGWGEEEWGGWLKREGGRFEEEVLERWRENRCRGCDVDKSKLCIDWPPCRCKNSTSWRPTFRSSSSCRTPKDSSCKCCVPSTSRKRSAHANCIDVWMQALYMWLCTELAYLHVYGRLHRWLEGWSIYISTIIGDCSC